MVAEHRFCELRNKYIRMENGTGDPKLHCPYASMYKGFEPDSYSWTCDRLARFSPIHFNCLAAHPKLLDVTLEKNVLLQDSLKYRAGQLAKA